MIESSSTISSVFLESFRENSSRIAIRRSKGFAQLTYEELYDRACRVASFLEENGIEADRGNRSPYL